MCHPFSIPCYKIFGKIFIGILFHNIVGNAIVQKANHVSNVIVVWIYDLNSFNFEKLLIVNTLVQDWVVILVEKPPLIPVAFTNLV